MKWVEDTLSMYAKRTLTVEHRQGYGWFVMSGSETLMGFHTKRLLQDYARNVVRRGRFYTPTIGETYGR